MIVELRAVELHSIWNYRDADEMRHNGCILCTLAKINENGSINKPVVIQAVSLIEAISFDFLARIQGATREGVETLPDEVVKSIRGKKVRNFNSLLGVFKSHKIYDGLGPDIYDTLHQLKRARNRVHIQAYKNLGKETPYREKGREDFLFDNDLVKLALETCLNVFGFLSKKHPRSENRVKDVIAIPIYVD